MPRQAFRPGRRWRMRRCRLACDLNWDKSTIQPLNAKRAQVSLDGTLALHARRGRPPSPIGVGYIKVPGDWQAHPDQPSSIVAPGSGPQWESLRWIARDARLVRAAGDHPRRMAGARRSACASTASRTDAIVYVNGTECGRVAWPWGSVDITRAVTPGQTADIRLLVAAIADPEKVGSFWQNALSMTSPIRPPGWRRGALPAASSWKAAPPRRR